MRAMDIAVVVGYFAAMIGVGALCARTIKKQDDFFLGGRGFGKLLQTFAAFGAGTGAQDPINVGRTTWTSGLSGIWSALMWLFVTPFYWIVGVWYRRMRHTTLGDWFVERYESRAMGVAYALFAFAFVICYLSAMFSAISKVAAPLLGEEAVQRLTAVIGSQEPGDLKFLLVPTIGAIVVIYGAFGGLAAAYWTDLIQGICIIVLSVILIPYGLWALVERFGDPGSMGVMDGFRIMHERLPAESFQLFGGPRAGEFPLHFIISLTLLGLVGIVVQPHFIATGGGSAKTETTARIGLVTGNFLKRLCTIGWALTALVVVALLADSAEIAADPDRAWGVASREILGRVEIGGVYLGLVGLMLACLLAALMSTADCFMVVVSALFVRNMYVSYLDPDASESTCLWIARGTGLAVIACSAAIAVSMYDVFGQYKMALEVAIVFAAPFWVGMYWRKASRAAAWGTISFSLLVFFALPVAAPRIWPGLATDPRFAVTNHVVTRTAERQARLADVARRDAAIALQQALGGADQPPPAIETGQTFTDEFTSGGKSVFWSEGVEPAGEVQVREIERREDAAQGTTVVVSQREGPMVGQGAFNVDFLLYDWLGVDLRAVDDATLTTLRLPTRLVAPFVVMILLSFLTRPGDKVALDRYYSKMKTPVSADPEEDRRRLEASYADPRRLDQQKLFPGTQLEIQKPTALDVVGFATSVGVCGLFVWLAYFMANLGS